MKIFVQGRKDGYKVLYPAPTPREFFRFGKDMQSINAQNQHGLYGKSVFSIAFEQGGRIYSKYVVGYDVQRANLGNICFSVFVPDNKNLPGEAVLMLLDELSAKYFNTYAPDFYINDVQENWSLFTTIADQYDAKLQSVDSLDIEQLERGTQDAAYIYYSSREHIAAFFDDPYQTVYTPFSQILFVDTEFKGKAENPLNALKISQGADLTERVDLDNKKYRLIVNPSSYARVDRINADGHRTQVPTNKRFHKKDVLFIKWSRQFYNSKEESGTIEDLKDYLDINELNRTVNVLPQNLQILTKDIQLQFLLREEPIKVDKFKCSNSQNEEVKLQENGILHFEGVQLVQNWTISASKGTTISIGKSFVPETSAKVMPLRASEKIRISFVFVDKKTGDKIHSAEITFTGISGKRREENGSIDFANDEIDKRVNLAFKAKGYQTLNQSIVPRQEHSEVRIELTPVPKKEPLKWEEDLMPETSNGHHRPMLCWLRRNLLPLILGSLLAVSLFFNIYLILSSKKEKSINPVKAATEYIEGPELLSSKLNEFAQLPGIKKDGSLYKRIESALIQRRFIDALRFQIESDSWDKNSALKKSPELSHFYQLCLDNKHLIGKMQSHLKDVWDEGIKDRPLKEINDTIRQYVELQKTRSTETGRVVGERKSLEISNDQPQADSVKSAPVDESSTTVDREPSTLEGLTTEKKPNIFEKIFGKRKK